MAERRPLVVIDGQMQELPSADTLPGAGGGSADYPDFTGNAGKHLSVNTAEDGVEWTDPPSGGSGSMTGEEIQTVLDAYYGGTGWRTDTDTQLTAQEIQDALDAFYGNTDWRTQGSGGGSMTGSEIEAALDSYYGNTDWRTGGSGGEVGTTGSDPTGVARFTAPGATTFVAENALTPHLNAYVAERKAWRIHTIGDTQAHFAVHTDATLSGSDFVKVFRLNHMMAESDYYTIGVFAGEQSSGLRVAAALFYDGNWVTQRWTGTAYTAGESKTGGWVYHESFRWHDSYWKIERVGTALTISISRDGLTWLEVYAVTVGDAEIPEVDQVGFYINTNNLLSTHWGYAECLGFDDGQQAELMTGDMAAADIETAMDTRYGSESWRLNAKTVGEAVPQKHRYWRLRSLEAQSTSSNTLVGDIDFRFEGVTVPHEPSLAFASAENNTTSNAAHAAFDTKEDDTVWSSGSTGEHWVAMDFEVPVAVDELLLMAGDTSTRADGMPISFVIEHSDDAVTWTLAEQSEGVTAFTTTADWAASEQRTFTVRAVTLWEAPENQPENNDVLVYWNGAWVPRSLTEEVRGHSRFDQMGLTNVTPVMGGGTILRNSAYTGPALRVANASTLDEVDVEFDANGRVTGAAPYGTDTVVVTVYDQWGSEDFVATVSDGITVIEEDGEYSTCWVIQFNGAGFQTASIASDMPVWRMDYPLAISSFEQDVNDVLRIIFGAQRNTNFMAYGTWYAESGLHWRADGSSGGVNWSDTEGYYFPGLRRILLDYTQRDDIAYGYFNGTQKSTANFGSTGAVDDYYESSAFGWGEWSALGSAAYGKTTELHLFTSTGAASAKEVAALDAAINEWRLVVLEEEVTGIPFVRKLREDLDGLKMSQADQAASYALVSSDFAGGMVHVVDADSDVTVTISADLSPQGPCTFVQKGTGRILVTGDAGVTVISPDSYLASRTTGSFLTLVPDLNTSNTYYLTGDLG